MAEREAIAGPRNRDEVESECARPYVPGRGTVKRCLRIQPVPAFPETSARPKEAPALSDIERVLGPETGVGAGSDLDHDERGGIQRDQVQLVAAHAHVPVFQVEPAHAEKERSGVLGGAGEFVSGVAPAQRWSRAGVRLSTHARPT